MVEPPSDPQATNLRNPVMVSSSSNAVSAQVAIAVAIAQQSVNTSEASRCQLL